MPGRRIAEANRGHFTLGLGPAHVDAPASVALTVAGKGDAVTVRAPAWPCILGKTGETQRQPCIGIVRSQTGHVVARVVVDRACAIGAQGRLDAILDKHGWCAAANRLREYAATPVVGV